MKIIFNGLPYFTKALVQELNTLHNGHRFLYLNTYYSYWDKIRFGCMLPFFDVFFSFNGTYDKSGSYDYACWLRKKIAVFWHGSDVLMLRKNIDNGKMDISYLQRAAHFSDAPWLIDELKQMGVECDHLHFKHVDCFTQHACYLSTDVLTYLPHGKERFYGWEKIKRLATLYPSLQFHVVATDGNALDTLSNIWFHGWMQKEEYLALLDRCAFYVRLPEHDGYSLSLLEAMAMGLEIISSYDLKRNTQSSLPYEQEFQQKYEEVKHRSMKRNEENIRFVKEHFNKNHVLRNFIAVLESKLHVS